MLIHKSFQIFIEEIRQLVHSHERTATVTTIVTRFNKILPHLEGEFAPTAAVKLFTTAINYLASSQAQKLINQNFSRDLERAIDNLAKEFPLRHRDMPPVLSDNGLKGFLPDNANNDTHAKLLNHLENFMIWQETAFELKMAEQSKEIHLQHEHQIISKSREIDALQQKERELENIIASLTTQLEQIKQESKKEPLFELPSVRGPRFPDHDRSVLSSTSTLFSCSASQVESSNASDLESYIAQRLLETRVLDTKRIPLNESIEILKMQMKTRANILIRILNFFEEKSTQLNQHSKNFLADCCEQLVLNSCPSAIKLIDTIRENYRTETDSLNDFLQQLKKDYFWLNSADQELSILIKGKPLNSLYDICMLLTRDDGNSRYQVSSSMKQLFKGRRVLKSEYEKLKREKSEKDTAAAPRV